MSSSAAFSMTISSVDRGDPGVNGDCPRRRPLGSVQQALVAAGREVRLRYAYFVTCTEVIKDDETGDVSELLCTYDPETKGGSAPDGRKVKGTLHWVSAQHAYGAEVRLYDHLFNRPDPEDVDEPDHDFKSNLNPNSLTVLKDCKLEPSLSQASPGDHYQFERLGYFCVDSEDSAPEAPVFNRTASLRDQWARIEKQRQNQPKKKGKKRKQQKK